MPPQVTIDVGSYRHRVSLQRPAEPQDQDTFGEPGDLWAVEWRRSARVEDLTGGKLVAAQALAAEASTQVFCRWSPSLVARKRFEFRGRLLYIQHVGNPDGLKVEAVCTCSEEVK